MTDPRAPTLAENSSSVDGKTLVLATIEEAQRLLAERDAIIRTQAALLARAREGLEPFAKADVCSSDDRMVKDDIRFDECAFWTNAPTVGDLRRARALIAEIDAANATGVAQSDLHGLSPSK